MCGAYLLYRYPVATRMQDPVGEGIADGRSETDQQSVIAENKRIESKARLGIILIGASFGLELLATFNIC